MAPYSRADEIGLKILSVVVPVFFNEQNLPETIPQLLALEDSLSGYRLELIFVDDDSKDQSLTMLLEYQKRFPNQIKVVKLTRNFGTMAALQAEKSSNGRDGARCDQKQYRQGYFPLHW